MVWVLRAPKSGFCQSSLPSGVLCPPPPATLPRPSPTRFAHLCVWPSFLSLYLPSFPLIPPPFTFLHLSFLLVIDNYSYLKATALVFLPYRKPCLWVERAAVLTPWHIYPFFSLLPFSSALELTSPPYTGFSVILSVASPSPFVPCSLKYLSCLLSKTYSPSLPPWPLTGRTVED